MYRRASCRSQKVLPRPASNVEDMTLATSRCCIDDIVKLRRGHRVTDRYGVMKCLKDLEPIPEVAQTYIIKILEDFDIGA